MAAVTAAAAAAAAAATITAAAATATAAGTDNNQLKAVTAMANAGGDGNSDDDGGRRRRHDNGGGGKGVTHEAAGGDAIGRGQRGRRSMQHQQYFLMLERAPGYFWVEFFVLESKRFMVEQNLILFYPWCYYATQKYPFMRRGICRTYVRNGTKMYGNRNYYRPPL